MLYMKSLGMVELKARLGDKMPNKKKKFFLIPLLWESTIYTLPFMLFLI